MKICAACGKTKHESEFSVSVLTSDGVSKRCSICIRDNVPQKIEFRNNVLRSDTYGLHLNNGPEVEKISLQHEMLGNKKVLIINKKLDLEKQISDLKCLSDEIAVKVKRLSVELTECRRGLVGVNKSLAKYQK